MLFYLDYTRSPESGAITVQQLQAEEPIGAQANTLYLQAGQQRIESIRISGGGKLLLLGDPVFRADTNLAARICPNGTLQQDKLYEEVRGHYYWFLLQPDGLLAGNSFGAIFPIYYTIEHNRVLLSSASFLLAEKTGAEQQDRRNLLERLLFNYPFFNSTWWKNIKLLEAHRYLNLAGTQANIEEQFQVEAHFGTGADASAEGLKRLADLFESETALCLPDGPFGISFTGGFDGRTLLAAARKGGHKNFITYSFGHPDSSDVTFPKAQTQRLKIPYLPIHLDDSYVQQRALPAAHRFMQQTEYNGNFGRPHYQYAAQKLSQKVDYIITGNFGSEMFRALHQPGVMMSEQLIRVFAATDNSWKDHLRQPQADWDKNFFKPEMDELISDLEAYLAPMQSWDANQRFYRFVFNDIFRKYFGPELVMQSHFFNNRTPFMSLRFFQELNKTIWSGVHAQLFEKTKSKRMKGQVFYASFIRQADKELYRLPTSKGYSPADVLEPLRFPLLLGRVAIQKFIKKEEPDSNSVDAFFQQFRENLLQDISPEKDPVLSQLGLAATLDQKGTDLEKTIKYNSIAAGWAAARKVGQNKTPLIQSEPS